MYINIFSYTFCSIKIQKYWLRKWFLLCQYIIRSCLMFYKRAKEQQYVFWCSCVPAASFPMEFFHMKNTQLTRKWPSSIQQGLWCHSCQHEASKAKQGPKQKHTWLTVAPIVSFCSDTQCWWSSWLGLSFWCIGWWAILAAGRRWRFWAFNQGGGGWMVCEMTAWKRNNWKGWVQRFIRSYSTLFQPCLHHFLFMVGF